MPNNPKVPSLGNKIINKIVEACQFSNHDKNDQSTEFKEEYKNLEKVKELKNAYRIGSDFTLEKCRDDRPILTQVLESAYRFGLGSISGIFGASSVYPIDFLKTRMQNVRKAIEGGVKQDVLYTSYFDCFIKSVKREGIFGLYKGIVPQIVGVAPEKAIKLSVHAFVRDRLLLLDVFENKLWCESFGGMSAGICQVLATNPLEIIKVRLQVAGEVGQKLRASEVVKELGLRGVYKGSISCMARDIPFSGIYFPSYAYFKSKLMDENGYNAPWTLLAAGTMAGVPAAGLVTPFDVIKTRIQVLPKEGDTIYNGLIDCAMKIMKEEGFMAFWKGTLARIIRSAPQFGVTLFIFEILQRNFYIDFDNRIGKRN